MIAFLARAALLLALVPPFAGTAHGHAAVVASEPADGAVLDAAPRRLRVVFNEPVSLISAQVLDAAGHNVVAADAATAANAAVDIPLPEGMARGTYVASYRVVSLDGHPVGGSLVFSVGEVSEAGPAAEPSHEGAWRAAWMIVRAAFDASLLGSAGAVLFLVLVAGTGPAAAGAIRIAGRLALFAIFAAALSIGVQGGLLAGGPLGTIADAATWRTGLASTFGRSALVASAGLVLIVASGRVASAAGRAAALAGALIALASFAFAGHVVTAGPRWLSVPALTAHVAAVAFWAGSLLPLRAALFHDDAAPLVRRFSGLAGWAVAVLVGAGIVIAALQTRGFAALVTTPYGWLLLAKLGLVGGLLSLAAFNKWRLTPALALGEVGAAVALSRAILAELALLAAILLVTAGLGTTPPPRAAETGHVEGPGYHAPGERHAPGLSVEMAGADLHATLAFASARAGPNEVEIAIAAEGGEPAAAQEVTFVAANPAAGVEPIRRNATPAGAGTWVVGGLTLAPAGEWSIRLEVLVSDFDKPILEGTAKLE
jgi:copper transport protein